MNKHTLVQVSHLNKTYDNAMNVAVKAVTNINLIVKHGEIVIISRPSGSGKTTLLSMLGCLMKPTPGILAL